MSTGPVGHEINCKCSLLKDISIMIKGLNDKAWIWPRKSYRTKPWEIAQKTTMAQSDSVSKTKNTSWAARSKPLRIAISSMNRTGRCPNKEPKVANITSQWSCRIPPGANILGLAVEQPCALNFTPQMAASTWKWMNQSTRRQNNLQKYKCPKYPSTKLSKTKSRVGEPKVKN